MNQISKQPRILAVSLSTRGFGYAVMEDETTLINYGHKRFNRHKNARSLAHIEKMITHNQPGALVLQDVNAKKTHRALRIKKLHAKVMVLAKNNRLKVVEISGAELRRVLLGNKNGTKHQMAELIAKKFPDELASRLPLKRKAYNSEDARMDIFDALGLAVVASNKGVIRDSGVFSKSFSGLATKSRKKAAHVKPWGVRTSEF